MIRHILFWKLTDEVKESGKAEEAAAFVAASVQTMVGKVDGLITAELGKNEAGGDYDLIFYSEFRDEKALEAFRDHPLHVAHRERCSKLVTGKLAGDLLTEKP